MSGLRRAVWTVGFLATALAIPVVAQAQGQRGGGMGMGGGMAGPGLISNPAVQKEIKLTDEQKGKATSFSEEYRSQMGDLRDLSPEERTTKLQKMNAEGMKDVEKMLKPEQSKRFKEIIFQVRGMANLADPEIAKALKVTAEQSDKVKNLTEAERSEIQEARQDAGDDRAAAATKTTAIRKATMTKAMALMTPDQKSMWKEMAGEPFELPAMGGGGRPPAR